MWQWGCEVAQVINFKLFSPNDLDFYSPDEEVDEVNVEWLQDKRAYTITYEDTIICVLYYHELNKGVLEVALCKSLIFKDCPVKAMAKFFMQALNHLRKNGAHRICAVVRGNSPRDLKFIKLLGFKFESILYSYLKVGEDAHMYVWGGKQ